MGAEEPQGVAQLEGAVVALLRAVALVGEEDEGGVELAGDEGVVQLDGLAGGDAGVVGPLDDEKGRFDAIHVGRGRQLREGGAVALGIAVFGGAEGAAIGGGVLEEAPRSITNMFCILVI